MQSPSGPVQLRSGESDGVMSASCCLWFGAIVDVLRNAPLFGCDYQILIKLQRGLTLSGLELQLMGSLEAVT